VCKCERGSGQWSGVGKVMDRMARSVGIVNVIRKCKSFRRVVDAPIIRR
jgi:hypothetical protein